MDYREKCKSAIYAAIIGDALGVPVESSTRAELALASVKNMFGLGRYDMPQGTWSDDTSMILCTMDSLCRGYDLEDLANTYSDWLFNGKWTPSGFAFDAGITTVTALEGIRDKSATPLSSGGITEYDNGNGSLMRILPAAIWFAGLTTEDFIGRIHEISAITHAHPRTLIGCGIYALMIREIIAGADKSEAIRKAVGTAASFYGAKKQFANELLHYNRIISLSIPQMTIDEIESSGYVVHTIEASLWCVLRHDTTEKILLEAVNLGLDTDTTGTVAGALAGLLYGLDGIPADWTSALARKDEIDELTGRFLDAAGARNC